MLGKVFHSPIENPSRILDVGCGTGAVTYHLGRTFPSAHIYGLDLAAIPPDPARQHPDNVTFVEGDYHDLLGAGNQHGITPGSVDFIFSRLLITGMTAWPHYVRICHTLLKPAGYLEIQESEFPYYDDATGAAVSNGWAWAQAYRQGAAAKGLDLDCAREARGWMLEAGFEQVRTKTFAWPHGEWLADQGREEYRGIGAFFKEEQPRLYRAILPNMVSGMGWSEEGVRGLQADVRETLEGAEGVRKNFWVTVGRKPG